MEDVLADHFFVEQGLHVKLSEIRVDAHKRSTSLLPRDRIPSAHRFHLNETTSVRHFGALNNAV